MSYYLFSYGSNNPTQLSERLNKNIDVIIPAYYPNHKLAFGSTSKKWLGGVATMIPSQSLKSFTNNTNNTNIIKKNLKFKNNVFGYLTNVSNTDLKILDKFEAVGIGKYMRKIIKVKTIDGDTIQAYAYFLTPEYIKWVEKPSDEYLRAIFKTQYMFWSNEFIIINIIKAENGELVDEWGVQEYHFKSMIAKIIKDYISDPMQQNITLSKFNILGLTNLETLKNHFNKKTKKLNFDIDEAITNLGYLPFKKNLQKEIEKELAARFL